MKTLKEDIKHTKNKIDKLKKELKNKPCGVLGSQLLTAEIELWSMEDKEKYLISHWSRCCMYEIMTADTKNLAIALRNNYNNSTGVSFDDPITSVISVAPWPLKNTGSM